MARRRSQPPSEFVSFSCRRCNVLLRIKAAHAHLGGRCPECAFRIDPPRPRPAVKFQRSDADEPQGLVPLDEEWPEPAQIDPGLALEFSSSEAAAVVPAVPPKVRSTVRAEAVEAYGVSEAEAAPTVAPPRTRPVERGYDFGDAPPDVLENPFEIPERALEREKELLHAPPPTPPRYPLWQGIYGFPWRSENLPICLTLAGLLTIPSFIAVVLFSLVAAGGQALLGGPLVLAAGAVAAFWVGLSSVNWFLTTVEATAAGNDRVTWPRLTDLIALVDGFGNLFYLSWIMAFGLLPCGVVAYLGGKEWGGLLAMLVWVILFPVFFLSSMASTSRLMILNGRVLLGLLRQPLIFMVLVLPALAVFLASDLIVIAAAALESPVVGALGMGVIWSAGILIYGRALGRAGWLLKEQYEPTHLRTRSVASRPPRTE